ncbi:VanZ family protein [Kribbella kalugense]|uniref:VanZ like protein n=1 Tax=Kribbella kalugense TaxID=2512221 RepID=A0A4R7ZWI1_9ACTN|nr:VanZ family protein [Kribbella kalugense]TDW22463.1 VanZ like protein [Kribbella kalugense]
MSHTDKSLGVMMHGWVETFTGVAALTVFALPLAALLVCLLAYRRGGSTSAWRTSLAEVGIVYWTVPSVWLTMVPGSHAGSAARRVSLIPLRDLATMPAVQIVGNLLIFAALGFLAPLRFTTLASLPRILALAATSSILIELAQYTFPLDRVSSIDDVLLNTLGAGLAALASRPWWHTTQPTARPRSTSTPGR